MADGVYSRRFQTIAQMARDAAEEVTSSEEEWKRCTGGNWYMSMIIPGTKYDYILLVNRQEVETIDLFNTFDTRGQSPSYGMNYQELGQKDCRRSKRKP
ncbi:MAG: hypothetical protein IJM34_11555 [Lachnospiraceae bacterium]|nr:hypothetical protein [Lachnospiraceae bacterium]